MSIGASNDFLLDSDLLNGLDSLDSDKAALLELLLAEQDAASHPPAVPARIERTHANRAPLSSAQQRLWLLYCLDPDSAAYNLTSAFQVTGRLDVAALEQAVAGLVARHEILRTTFEEVVSGEWSVVSEERAAAAASSSSSSSSSLITRHSSLATQTIHPTLAIPLVVEDLTGLSAGEREAEIRRRLNEEAHRPFDLRHGPALRLRLLRRGEDSHTLVIAAHHIIYDGWSLSIFVRELAEFYEAHRDQRPVALPPPALQYADYALWEASQDFSQLVEERARALAGAPYLELPTDRPTPVQPKWDGAFVDFELPAELTARIRRLGRGENATLFTTLLAVFETLLHRYTGQADFLLGVPVANRRRPDIEGLIGFFVNTLAVRADLGGDPSFRDVLIRARYAVDEAFERQEAPFERIVQALHPERSAQQMPLVRVMFGLQNAPMGHLALHGLDLEPVRIERRSAKFDLVFLIHETADGLGGELEYNADVFDESTIRRMLGHYRVLLAAVAAAPDARVAALPLLTEAEQQQLARWNQTAAAYPREASIPGCFERQARRTPGAVAVDFGGQRLTYAELDQRANRLAHRLRAAGVGLETPVAINVPRSVDLIVGLLAILKAGGYYVPLDPAYPAERLALMLNDCGARVLLTRGDVAGPALGATIERIALDQADAYVGPSDRAPAGPFPTGDSLAYVIYTSGSTGVPKGVAVPHRAVLRLVLNTDYVDFRPEDRIAQASNASFDAATFEIWGALLNGARLVGIERDITLSPPQFAAVLREQAITTLFLTTALFNQMAREAPGAFGTLRHVLFGGEQVDPQRVREVLRDGPPERLLHVYGPTENTTFSTWHLVEAVPEDAATVPIGQPIANSTAYVLDSRLQPLPVGVPGELYVGGEGLARGYLGQPELTSERFVEVASEKVASGEWLVASEEAASSTSSLTTNHWPLTTPFIKVASGQWSVVSKNAASSTSSLTTNHSPLTTLYKTGDIVLRQPDGSIVFVGRRDHQVKIRGFRVELGEIEAALLTHLAVQEAVAVFAGGRLGAYLVASEAAAPPAVAELRRHLAQTLPDYMIPSDFLALDALPLNVNGKVDRERLPEIPRGGAEPAATAGPRGATEEILAGIWAKVLGLAEVGDADNFFELGGHSLLATQVISRIREAFGVELPLRALFQAPTVAGLAGQIEAARRLANGAPPVIRPVPHTSAPALSFAQERLWFLDQLEPGNPFYNVPIALTLTGPLDVTALRRSIEAVAQRHEVLRTTFPAVDGKPVQAIAATAVVALPVLDVTGGEDEAARLMAEEARQPFDLAAGPLLRTRLLRLGADRHVLLFTLHHIIADGWSLGVLVNELVPLYRHFRSAAGQGTETTVLPLPPLTIQYADFAAWQRDWLGGGVMEAQFAYWREQLRDAPPVLDLPTDRPRPPVQSYRGNSVHFRVEAAVADALRKLSRRGEATLFMTLLAAFATLLHRYSGQDDLVIGSPIANRHRGEVEPLIGFFVNTLALRVDVRGNPAFADLLAQVRRTALDAYAHQDLPFEKLVDELQPDRDLSLNPLFQVMFALQNAPLERLALAELDAELIEAPHQMALFDLVLDMWEAEGALAGVLEYNTDLFDEASVQRLVRNFQTLLESIAADAARPVDALPWLTEAERDALLAMGAGPRRDYPVDQALHALFERTAAAYPERIAAVHNGVRVSYAEIEARANRIAHRLRRMGVGANDFVAILDQRGPDVLAAMLGILKAGGAFLPLDPAYPPERIRYMLADSGVRVLISRTARLAELAAEAYTGQVLRLDADDWADEPSTPPAPLSGPADLAYMLYTSGSTGLPKGAMIRHDGAVNHIYAEFELLAFHRDTAFLQSAPSSSDISVWQFLAPGLIGGRTVIVDYETVCDPAALLRTMREESITLIELVPAVMKALLDHAGRLSADERALPNLEWAMVTGEAANPALVNQWLATYPEIKLVNAYGPTEAADDISQSVLDRPLDSDRTAVPIGRPLANLTLYVLDRQLNLVPQGVPGEICVSGIGVGAGYWRNEARTRESFVPNPYAGGGRGEVIYRTGDLGRWLPDGTLECLERLDDQVKLRGFRIELGEIEGVLNAHPAVREAVAVIHGEGADDKRLAAYLVPDSESAEVRARLDELRREQVELWQDLHEDSYRDELLRGDVTFNVIGWDSNYTGQPLPEADMREYVGFTIERIRSLNPRRVLEIGCGTGLIMFPLLPHCEAYTGTDLSHVSIDRLRALRDTPELRARIPGLDRAELLSRRADDTDWLAPGAFDTVVFPSVVQYFPGIDYFLTVLDGLFNKALAAGGSIFVGDVRSLPLLEAFHANVQLHKAAPADSAAAVAERTRQRVAQEQEMAIDPAFFLALKRRYPAIAQVDILPKRGFHHNEMTRFRYDVLIRTGAAAEPVAEFDWLDWRQARPAVDALRRRLSEERPAVLALRRIANARVTAALAVVDALRSGSRAEGTAAEIQARAAAASVGIEPEDLWQLGRELGYRVDVSLAGGYADGGFDAVFRPVDEATGPAFPAGLPDGAAKPWSRYANNPLHEKLARRLTPDLREFLKDKLPHYMVPSHFTVLTGLPLTPAGKVDRRALPPPDVSEQVSDHAYVAPRNATEQALARIWAEILGLTRVGIQHNFFELGGHSLKATQVVSRIQRELSAQVALRDVFAHPTIAELAPRLVVADTAAPVAIPKAPDAADYPLSHAQRRLWVLAQLEGASVAYNMPMALLIEGPVDVAAFGAAFTRLVERHEALRTAFIAPDGVPRQRVLPAGGAEQLDRPARFQKPGRPLSPLHTSFENALEVVDLSQAADPEEVARIQALADAVTPFDLEHGLPVRGSLLRLGETRHVLLLNMHHIVSDDWSLNVMVREFVQLYAALVQGQPPDLPPLGLQYRDYACWQENYLASETATAHQRYWLGKLAGHLPLLNLATDFPRPPIKTYRGRAHAFRLDSRQTAGLAALARERQASLFMVLAAAVKALLYRYTGQEDILLGFPIAGRDHPDLENQIGFYINTLPLRDEVQGGEPFLTLLERVKATATEAYEHQAYPFDRLVDELDVARDVSRSPMFDVVIVMQNASAAAPPIEGLSVRPFLRDYEASKFDLGFVFEERDGELRVDLAYNTDLFLPARIERMAGHFRELAAGIVADAATPVDRLPMLPEDERRLILREWTPAPVVQPKGPTLVGWFEAQAARAPERLAVVGPAVSADFAPTEATPRRTLSYGELNAQANRLAHRLRRLGAGPETLVGLCLPRTPDLVVGLLGILKAGAAYLPLDTVHPAERWAFMLNDAQVAVVVTESALADRFAGTTAIPLCLDAEAAALATESPANPAPLAGPDHLAYVIYTSGSTGRPKGVAVTHHNVARLFSATESLFGFNEDDVWSLFHSAAFDFSVWELWGALLYGGRVVIVPHWVSRVPQAFLDLLAREGVTVLNQTPSAFRQLVQADEDAGGAAGLALRYVVFGGEALDLKSLRPWFDRHGDQRPRLVNMYGITETTVHVTYRPLSRADVDAPGSLIGRALPDLTLHLLDAHRQPVPIGVAGEIYVGGGGVSRGYLNRPELTAERFLEVASGEWLVASKKGARGEGRGARENAVSSPALTTHHSPLATLYKSGDLGRYLPNGDIEYLGRIDQQVQIRGFRVELGEIEAALAEHPEVREAVVLAHGEGSRMRLVGYFIPAAGTAPTADTLRRHLRTRLPEYMVPAALMALDAFPLTANGKLDRAALPSPEEARASDTAAATPYAEPASEMEATLAALFGEVLGGARVGLHDNFFDLGANSLVLVQVQRRLRDALSREVPVILLFQFPTVAALAARLAEPDSESGETTAVRQAQDRAAQRKAARATRRTPSR